MRFFLTALTVLALAGCGTQTETSAKSSSTGQVIVFAAASLTESFTKIGRQFEQANPGTTVKLNFAGSSALARQINQGAPADVFASASPTNMQQAGDAASPVTFARNRLEIAVAKGNPLKIASLADAAAPEVKLALCAEQVPCGAAAKKAFQTAALSPSPVTLEQDVKSTLTKLRLGEVDAAVVYRTDVHAAESEVDGVDFPEAEQAVNDCPIATLSKAPNAAGAKNFVDYVQSEKGKEALREAGFETP
jgi:molybdate transport system substrate-binding protein